MKRFVFFLVLILTASCVYAGTVTKGPVGKQDVQLYYSNGSGSTFSRTTSLGYDLTLNVVDWVGIDVLQVYGGGVNATDATIQAALDDVGTNHKVEFWLAPVRWDIDSSVDASAHNLVTWRFAPGAYLDQVTGDEVVTIYSPAKVKGSGKIADGDMVDFAAAGTVYPEWWGANASDDCAGPLQYAINALGGYGGEIILSEIYKVGSSVTIDGVDDDLTLRGLGRMECGLVATADATPLKLVGSAAVEVLSGSTEAQILNNTNLINLTIDADGKTANALEIDIAKRTLIDHCYIVDGNTYGIKCGDAIGTGDGSDRFNTVEIRGQTIVNMTKTGATAHVYAHNGSLCDFTNIVCLGTGVGNDLSYSFDVSGMSNTVFSHNQCTNVATAAFYVSTTQAQEDNGRGVQTLIFKENHFESLAAGAEGIIIDVDHDVVHSGVHLHDNRFPDTGAGKYAIKLTGDGGASKIHFPVIEYNRIPASTGAGIHLDGSVVYHAQIGPQTWARTVGPVINNDGVHTEFTGHLQTAHTAPRKDNTLTTTAGTGEDNLANTVIEGGQLGSYGGIIVYGAGSISGANDTKDIWLLFGAASTSVISAAAGDETAWAVDAIIMSSESDKLQHWKSTGLESDGTIIYSCPSTTVDTGSDVTVKLVGVCGNGGDEISQTVWVVDWL